MTIPIGAFIVLMVCLAIGSIIFGWSLGKDYTEKRISKELKEQALEDFKVRFYNQFVENYNAEVLKAAAELVEKTYDKYEEKLKAITGKDNLADLAELMEIAHDELEKENENESTCSS